jgi:hypothetical protein
VLVRFVVVRVTGGSAIEHTTQDRESAAAELPNPLVVEPGYGQAL